MGVGCLQPRDSRSYRENRGKKAAANFFNVDPLVLGAGQPKSPGIVNS